MRHCVGWRRGCRQTRAADCGILANAASGSESNEAEDAAGNNSGETSIQVQCSDPIVEKIADSESVTVGDQIGFTIRVSNPGEGAAYDLVVMDKLPTGFNWTVSSDDAATCETQDGTLVCTIAELPAGASADIVVTAPTNVASCETVTNLVSIKAGNEPDDVIDNNSAEAAVTIICPPDEPDEPSEPSGPEATPVKTLPTTGTSDGAGSAYVPIWALIATAIVAMAGAMALRVTPASVGRRRENDQE